MQAQRLARAVEQDEKESDISIIQNVGLLRTGGGVFGM